MDTREILITNIRYIKGPNSVHMLDNFCRLYCHLWTKKTLFQQYFGSISVSNSLDEDVRLCPVHSHTV